MSYWASLEIEMSLLGKRLSAGQFIKESVRAVKQVVELLTVFQESKTDPTVSFINRPLQMAFCRNGVHELVLQGESVSKKHQSFSFRV